jgi:hypothetical protein
MELSAEQIQLMIILENFFRKPEHGEAPLLYTTTQVFDRLQSVYPGTYEPTDVYRVIVHMEFEYINSTRDKILWMIQERG